MKRPDEQSRQSREGAGAVGSGTALRQLANLVRDPSPRSRRHRHPFRRTLRQRRERRRPQGKRFDELDCDNRDFAICRDIIAALGHSVDPDARSVLERIAGRKAIIKRGHFAAIADLARQALETCNQGGDR